MTGLGVEVYSVRLIPEKEYLSLSTHPQQGINNAHGVLGLWSRWIVSNCRLGGCDLVVLVQQVGVLPVTQK